MGQLLDLHNQLQGLLHEIRDASGGQIRVFAEPPNALPEMPCIYLLTPDEDFQRLDTEQGEKSVVFTIRLCVEATKPQTTLLQLADTVCETADLWLWNTPPEPVDRARRAGMRGVTPVFGETPVRGADFPISIQMVTPIHPSP